MKNKLILLSYSFLCLIACSQESSKIKVKFTFPKDLKEVSAIEIIPNSNKIWALQDSGNKAELYALDRSGKISQTLSISNIDNNDWEALASDENGNIYIGDFGNNDNDRKNLAIYKINNSDLNKKSASASSKIEFYYPEQSEFPPKKSERIFDAEAFFYLNNNFYIFTKNRNSKFDGTTSIYKVPNQAGRHSATLIGKFQACNVYKKCAITAADISPDGKKVILLSATKVWLFENFQDDKFTKGKVTEIDLDHFSQKEGICFDGNSKVLIADEKEKKTGGKVYEMNLNP